MQNKVIDHLTNPTRARLFFAIHENEQLTAKQLMEKFPDITQPTLYRHLKAMLKDGILQIASEKQVRGMVEKTYAIHQDMGADISRIVEENDGEGFLQLFIQYITNITGEFAAYAKCENIDIIQDMPAFSVAPIYASREELIDALTKISEIILPLVANEPTPERQLRNFCIITTPPKK